MTFKIKQSGRVRRDWAYYVQGHCNANISRLLFFITGGQEKPEQSTAASYSDF